jgi:hypothetical protein
VDIYTLVSEAKLAGTITALRIEALTDTGLPAKGPGRAANGNFVLNELRANQRPLDKPDEKPKPVKLNGVEATVDQDGFPVKNATDNNPATGWAIGNGIGKNQAALFRLQQPVKADDGVLLTVVMDQRFGGGHNIGKFRLSVTADKNPRLSSPVTPNLAKLLDTPAEMRTAEQKATLRNRYLAQDAEYKRLAVDAAKVPPSDPRVLGAQDLAWALINTPAFLFNH